MAAPRLLPVAEGIVCVQRREFLSCSYVVRTDAGAVLVDAGIDPSGQDMVQGLLAVGRRAEDVHDIVLTHWHNDHVAGAPAIQRSSGATAHYHAAGADRFQRTAPLAPWRARLARRLPDGGLLAGLRGLLEVGPPEPLASVRTVADGDLVAGAFRAYETPGHEDGHLAWLHEPTGVLFCGDALAVAKGRVAFMSRYLTRDIQEARRSMARCLDLDVAAYCPGHREPLRGVTPDLRARAHARLAATHPWPVYGC